MTEAYKVSVELELEDKFTAKLKEIAKKLEEAGEKVGEAGEGLKKYSEGGDSLVKMLNETTRSLTALGSNGGLKSAVSSFDRMANASAKIAQNMRAVQQAGAHVGGVIAHGSSNGGHGGLVGKPQFKTRKATSALAAEGAEGAEVAEAAGEVATVAEIAESGAAAGAVVAKKAFEVGAESFKKNADLERANYEIARIDTPESERPARIEHLKEKEFEDFKKFGFVTHGAIDPFAEAREEAYKAFSSQPSREKKEEFTDAVMPGAAEEARQGKIGLPEITAKLSEFVEQAHANSGKQAASLIDSAIQASKKTGTQLDEVVENAQLAGKALESAAESGSENASHFMLLIATMQHGKMLDTESRALLDTLSTDALPEKLDSKSDADKKRMEAGNELGLFEGDKAKFYQGDKIDLMSMVSIVAKARLESKLNKEEFKAKIIALFGTKNDIGERLASFVEEKGKANLEGLAEMPNAAGEKNSGKSSAGPEGISEKWDQLKADVTMALMNQTASFKKPVERLLDYALKASAGAVEFSQKHPDELMQIVKTGDFSIPVGDAVADWMNNRKKAESSFDLENGKKISAATLKKATETPAGGYLFASKYGKKPESAPAPLPGSLLPPPPVPQKPAEPATSGGKSKMQEIADNANNYVEKNFNFAFYLDGKEIAAHMIPANSNGTSSFNTAATRPSPNGSALGHK
ncbi:MAG: hypothetical protein P4L91_06845 [Burkholderiaceae bacterium]|nr:hypothetical protein [Burkholderiaceae bacterium]